VKKRNIRQKIEILVENQNFRQDEKFRAKIEIMDINTEDKV